MEETVLNKAIKELLRVVVISVIPILIEALTQQSVSWRSISVALMIAILKGVDEYLHKNAEMDGWLKRQGLTGF